MLIRYCSLHLIPLTAMLLWAIFSANSASAQVPPIPFEDSLESIEYAKAPDLVNQNNEPPLSLDIAFETQNRAPLKPEHYRIPADDWEIKLTPYGFLSGFSGKETDEGFTTPQLKAGFWPLLKSLNFYSSGRAEVWHHKWGIIVDGYYTDLNHDFDTRVNIPPGTFIQGRTVQIPAGRFRPEHTLNIPPGPGLNVAGPDINVGEKLCFLDLAGSYRFGLHAPSLIDGDSMFIEPIWGLRLGHIRQELAITSEGITGLLGAPGRRLENSGTYLEPFIGTNLNYRLSKRLSASIRGDIGGFGIGDAPHLTWNLISTVGIHIREGIILNLGYAIKDINYQTGSGRTSFDLNGSLKGPWVGITFKF